MKHVIALDVSKGKSSMVVYDGYCQCEFEGELHKRNAIFRFFHFCDPYIFKTGDFYGKIHLHATPIFSCFSSIQKELDVCVYFFTGKLCENPNI
ncbi:hypothetical protein JOC94_000084 [Bacillus thermophilus]|uniref:Transposase IS111A/IS1328/IS1533 N-terminal domain-containing protein n=1 Tax=Siminovitchia thermophila TaxID=1245522 RepID=A0ABS2R0E5_9BACI|nr:hypothetical protein [Siminovitchia thermophila]MBM7713118.1 hypothetical protein [Siminovitchia thermophila]ONK24848.1 hypothetical protein BLX87_03165 [Bacillus sp. VT-16-64]